MLVEEVLGRLVNNRDRIFERLKMIEAERIDDGGSSWVEVDRSAPRRPTVGVDGSCNYLSYKGVLLYAIDAEGVALRDKVEPLVRLADVDVLVPPGRAGYRVKVLMNILELRAALYALKHDPDSLVLLDGSFLHMIERPPPERPSYWDLDGGLEELEGTLEGPELELWCKRKIDELLPLFPGGERDERKVVLYEYLEYLELLRKVLSPEYRDRIVAIAKSSESTAIFRGLIPDIVKLEYSVQSSGFYWGDLEKIYRPPEVIGLPPRYAEFFCRLEFTVTYTRLEVGGPMVKVEVPGRRPREEVARLLGSIARASVQGYPYVLRRAHQDVVITHRDMDTVARVLGLDAYKTGREVVEQ